MEEYKHLRRYIGIKLENPYDNLKLLDKYGDIVVEFESLGIRANVISMSVSDLALGFKFGFIQNMLSDMGGYEFIEVTEGDKVLDTAHKYIEKTLLIMGRS